MKTRMIIFAFLLILVYFFSERASAQTPPSGGECPRSYSVTKNNGNGWGVCGGDAQVRVIFSPMPSSANVPVLTAIYYQGRPATKIVLPVEGNLVTKGQGYISYCLIRKGQKENRNTFDYISQNVKVILEFTYADGTICRTDVVN